MPRILTFLVGFAILSSCYELPDADNIVLPTWNVEGIHIPIVNQTKTLQEILEDDSSFTWFPENGGESPGVLYYSQIEDIEGTTVGDRLKLDQTNINTSTKIGPITINDIPPIETNIPISDWTPFSPEETAIVPPLTVTSHESGFSDIETIQQIQLNTGKIRMNVENNLPVDVTYSGFQILNNDGSGVIITKPIPTISIEPNGTEEIDIELEEGIDIINSLLMIVDMSTDGSGGQFVTFPKRAGTFITAELVETEISRVIAAIPENVITIDSTFSVDSGGEPVQLALAEISGGSFIINIQSSIDIDTELDITFHDLYDNSGQKFTIVETIPRMGTLQFSEANMSGWKIEPLELTDELQYSITARTIETASNDYREISEHDSFDVSIQFSELLFTKVDGSFSTEFQLEEQTFEIDYGEMYDQFTFEEIKLEDSFIYLDLLTSAFLPVNINNATLTASNGFVTNTISIDQISLPSAVPVAVDVSELFEGMTQLLPNNFTFNGNADVNPAKERIEVADTDSIFGNADIEIPLKIMIAGGSYTELFELEIDDDAKDEIDNIQRIRITFELENGIPAGVSLVASVLDSLGNIILNIPTENNVIDKIEVTAPLINADGEIVETGKISESLELSGEEVLTFLRGKSMQLFFEFETAETTNEIVRFRITDTITYRAWGEADYRFEN